MKASYQVTGRSQQEILLRRSVVIAPKMRDEPSRGRIP